MRRHLRFRLRSWALRSSSCSRSHLMPPGSPVPIQVALSPNSRRPPVRTLQRWWRSRLASWARGSSGATSYCSGGPRADRGAANPVTPVVDFEAPERISSLEDPAPGIDPATVPDPEPGPDAGEWTLRVRNRVRNGRGGRPGARRVPGARRDGRLGAADPAAAAGRWPGRTALCAVGGARCVWCDEGRCDGGCGDGYPGECGAPCAPARSTTPARCKGGDAVGRVHRPRSGWRHPRRAGSRPRVPWTRTTPGIRVECLAGPPEQRLDRSDFDALVVRDLLVGPARVFAERQHMAMAHRKAVEGPVGQLSVIGRDDHLAVPSRHLVTPTGGRAPSSRSSVGVLRQRRRSMSVQMFPAMTVNHG